MKTLNIKSAKVLFVLGLLVFNVNINVSAQTTSKEMVLKSIISDVTVYLKGAQVTRNASVNVNEGKSTIKLAGLSPYIDAKSVQVRINNSKITVLSVNYQMNFMDSLKQSKEVKLLEQQLEDVKDKLNLENAKLEVINEDLNFLRENIKIGGTNEGVTLTKLKETSVFYSQQVNLLKNRSIEVKKNISRLSETRNELTNQLSQQGKTKQEPTGEVLVAVDTKTATNCNIELSYYVNNAGWYPSYDIRSISVNDPIELTYKANIQQNTKEDWKNVKLKVSSINPNMGNTPPQLQTYFLDYYTAPPRYDMNFNRQIQGRVTDSQKEPLVGVSVKVVGSTIGTTTDVNGSFSLTQPSNNAMLEFSYIGMIPQTLPVRNNFMNVVLQEDSKQLNEVVVVGYGIESKGNSVEYALQGKASGLDVSKSLRKEKSASLLVVQSENQTAVEFEIKTPYTVLSDNKSITVDMETYTMPAKYEYFTIPKADKDAFLLAYIRDWEKYNLLEGEANIFYENSFVGKTILDTRAMSDTLNISLGRDKNVQIKREKVKEYSVKKFFGSKKEETRVWKITVRNNKKQTISLALFDQIPLSTVQEIEVVPENLSGGKLNKETGEIKWNFEMNPSEKKEFELKYTVKYPKDRNLLIE